MRESEAVAAPMLVTKALSQDVMVLAFIPLSLIPEESPILHYNQHNHINTLEKCQLKLSMMDHIKNCLGNFFFSITVHIIERNAVLFTKFR
ncbi:hypothetical protein [Lysinibacillus sp. NPDC056232]|uniref:hypothetical protein n=1 Tax=Lysinibacillus sp. NPDC056232 TaxID=3345756 RepID=UPI0035D62FF0